jgi:hypothetical protein
VARGTGLALTGALVFTGLGRFEQRNGAGETLAGTLVRLDGARGHIQGHAQARYTGEAENVVQIGHRVAPLFFYVCGLCASLSTARLS